MGRERDHGKVITARGPVDPSCLGRVLMHEHLHCDVYDWAAGALVDAEKPMTPERRHFLAKEAIPYLRQCVAAGCRAFLEATAAPWRAWPTYYAEASEAAGINIIVCTGFYREVEAGTYWVKKPEEAIWPLVRESSVEELAERCTREIQEGIHGTAVRAGAIKVATSAAAMTDAERKALRAAARAQKATGVHITTHCTGFGAQATQLELFESEGVDPRRVVIGHTAGHLMDPSQRRICIEWMRRGASFLPTNLVVDTPERIERFRVLVDAIHELFDAGLGDRLVFGLDCAFISESGPFDYCGFIPRPPFLYLFTDVLPAFRSLGLTAGEESMIMEANPQRVLPVAV
jgi:predicted metal-dependent phosphotriesterase family hydrolase